MQILDIIKKKRDGHALTDAEIAFFVRNAANQSIPDYQIAALLMAMFIRGLSQEETLHLTMEMAQSGDMLPLKKGVCDKHSTGGTGDTTTFVLLPLVMAAGGKMAKISGRGLGHTGGTIDKAEAISGFRTSLTESELEKNLAEIGGVLTAQTGNIAPADKILYALRDVTATVDSLPLIAASIMSKKLALGAENIVLDVKCGSGAFMKTEGAARALSKQMVEIGKGAGRNMKALITRMDAPLGAAVGNSLELIEAIETLKGKSGPLLEVSLRLAACLTGKSETELLAYIQSGAALNALQRLIKAQGGDEQVVWDYDRFPKARYTRDISLRDDGFLSQINGEAIGHAAVRLGAGRLVKEAAIDHAAGIYMHKTIGDKGHGTLCTLYTNHASALDEAEAIILDAITLEKEKPTPKSIICGIVE